MRALVVTLLACLAVPACADAPYEPDSWKIVYELIHSRGGADRLEATWTAKHGRLVVQVTEQRTPRTITVDPWPAEEAAGVWREVARAKIYAFKPEMGPGAPDYGEVRLAVESTQGTEKSATSLAWTAPLKNDGPIWPLVNRLDNLMNPANHAPASPAAAPASPAPGSPGAAPASPAPEGPASPDTGGAPSPAPSPAALVPGEIDALIAGAATRLPLLVTPLEPPTPPAIAGALAAAAHPRLVAARARIDARLAVRPRAELLAVRAVLQIDLGDLQGAAADFTRAIELEPHRAEHRHNRGVVMARLGRLDAARTDLAMANRLAPARFPPAAIALADVPVRSWLGRPGRHLAPPRVDLH